jgi:hypothetical protein
VGKSVGEGNFVRRVGENQTYSVEPAISVETEPRYWIDSRLLDVPATLIQSIEVKPAAGAAYSIRRLGSTDNAFSLDGVPAGRKPLDGPALAPAATTFTSLTAEDVARSSDLDFTTPTQAIVTLNDGTVITLTGAAGGDNKHWLQIKSSKDAALTAKTSGRAFEIASYRYDAIFKPLDHLLMPKETPAPKQSPAAASGAKRPPAATGPASPPR